jgi:hypothetical protein
MPTTSRVFLPAFRLPFEGVTYAVFIQNSLESTAQNRATGLAHRAGVVSILN